MLNVVEVYEENLKKHPDMVVVRSIKHDEGLTYRQVEDISGRVYNYLKSKNIGTNDVVSLIVDRDVWFFPLMIGVMKASATYIFIENITPKERMDFMIADSGTKLVISDKDIDEICKYDYTSEYKIADMYAPCFILYTSGTTGNPKGILHEYGKWNTIFKIHPERFFKKHTSDIPELYALTTSLNFAVTIFNIYAVIFLKKNVYIVSYDILKNIEKMECFLIEKQVTTIFLTPSYVKKMKKISKSLDTILLAGEPANNLYVEGPRLVNALCSSETLITVSSFVIDKPYANCPVGEITKEYVCLKDETGSNVEKGNIGEICIKNEYTRGYINLPEENEKVFTDGFCHTGDLAYIDKDDNLIFAGRKDDMIKINGNRIEPLEVEHKIMESLGLKNAIVKAFDDNDRKYLCAYLLKNELIGKDYYDINANKISDVEFVNHKLQSALPQYMIPTYYVVLDDYPRNANGKIQKMNINPPSIEDFRKKNVVPTNDIEIKICDAFSKVLKIDKVGLDDNFFELGGDSIKTLELLILLDNNWLTTKDIYENNTVRKLAEKYIIKSTTNIGFDSDDEFARQTSIPLMDEQVAVLDVQFMDVKSTCFNITVMIKLNKNVDIERFERAVNKVFYHHPAFNTSIFFDEDANLVQGIRDRVNFDVEKINISEKEFNNIKDDLVKPFVFKDYINHRKKIFITEKDKYFFFDIFHIIADGNSVKIILKEIYDCYVDENAVLPHDYYYLTIKQYVDFMKSKNIEAAQEYYKKKYLDKYDFNINMLGLTPDSMDFTLKLGYISRILDAKRSQLLNSKIFTIMGDNMFYFLLYNSYA